MRKQAFAILGVLALAVFSLACGQSDLGITTKVKSTLETDRNVDASQIQVTTQNKVVTLSGPVASAAARERAVAIARGVEGVVDVVDNLSVTAGVAAAAQEPTTEGAGTPGGPPNDNLITQAVKQKLQSQSETAAAAIDVDTHEGVVTLSGSVKTAQEKEQVLQIARNTEGVQKVEDRLTVATS